MNLVNGMLRAATYTKTETESSGNDVYMYTTIKYETGTIDQVDYVALRGVTVDVDVNVGIIKVTYVKARYGYTGINYYTRKLDNVTSAWTQKNGVYLNINVDGSKLECVDGGFYWGVWGEGLAHITRGSSAWDITHKVIENGMGLP